MLLSQPSEEESSLATWQLFATVAAVVKGESNGLFQFLVGSIHTAFYMPDLHS